MKTMAVQLSMFDLFRPAPLLRVVDPDGLVVSGRIHTVLRLPHPCQKQHDLARIEIHPHENYWMWATAFNLELGGSGYRVGPKWGLFAVSMEDAIYYAVHELRNGVARYDKSKSRIAIERWLALYEPINWHPGVIQARLADPSSDVLSRPRKRKGQYKGLFCPRY